MATIRLYLDEDVFPLLATVLRARGFDAVSVHETPNRGRADAEQFAYATKDGRAILTFNIRDYVPLAVEAIRQDHPFAGVILSDQLPFRDLLRRVLRLLRAKTAEQAMNSILWLSEYR